MATNNTGIAWCDMPFTDVILFVLEDVWSPYKCVRMTKVMADGRTLQEMVLDEHKFDIAQQMTLENRQTPLKVHGSCLMSPWPHLLMANAYVFVRVQEGK
jgi:hypothetical protein